MIAFISDLSDVIYIGFIKAMIWCLEFELAMGETYNMGSPYKNQLKNDIHKWEAVLHKWEINHG